MTSTGWRRPRAYPATKQQPRVKLHLPRVLPRMRNVKVYGRTKRNSTAPSQNTSQKTWVEDTERVRVVDREAWTETFPSTAR